MNDACWLLIPFGFLREAFGFLVPSFCTRTSERFSHLPTIAHLGKFGRMVRYILPEGGGMEFYFSHPNFTLVPSMALHSHRQRQSTTTVALYVY
ncbi:hypothetical protein AB1N83_006454 [Pleurotus pulmonarius]